MPLAQSYFHSQYYCGMMSFVLNIRGNKSLCLSYTRKVAQFRYCRFRSHLIELDSDQNVGATGFDVVMQRAANILICNADQQFFTKILHVHPESTLTKHLSKVIYQGYHPCHDNWNIFALHFAQTPNMEIVGLSDQQEGIYNYAWYLNMVWFTLASLIWCWYL